MIYFEYFLSIKIFTQAWFPMVSFYQTLVSPIIWCQSNTKPFSNWTDFYLSNTRLVHYSDPSCIHLSLFICFFLSDSALHIWADWHSNFQIIFRLVIYICQPNPVDVQKKVTSFIFFAIRTQKTSGVANFEIPFSIHICSHFKLHL